jgi:hypothetical protein
LLQLATRVTRIEDGPANVEAVRRSLYHCHVPALADAGLVDFSPERRSVALADDAPDDSLARLASLQ